MRRERFMQRTPRLVLALLATTALLVAAGPATAQPVDLATGVGAGVGIAYDEVNNDLYYVEWTAGTLKRINLTPACEGASPPSCTIDTVASGFSHPQDVAIDAATGIGYVTTRDDPGTSGALWRVDLASGTKSLVTFNLGAPHQIALDAATSTLYTVGFDNGILWRIDLTTGVKVAAVSGLGGPIGLAITADRTMAYVTEQTPDTLAEYDLAVGSKVRDLASGLTAPFYLSWADPAEINLYMVERDPANQVSSVDLVSTSNDVIISGLPFRPSGIAINHVAGAAYVTTDTKVVRVALAEFDLGEPVFLGVGHVPSTSIVDGYATTDATYFYKVKDSPFGGTMNIFGNLSHWAMLTATHYAVDVTAGGSTTALKRSWTAYKWNTSTHKYEPEVVAPIAPGSDLYEIPGEYPLLAGRWYPPFRIMRWPSSANGLHTFQVRIYRADASEPTGFADLTHLLPAAKNDLTVLIDNTAPTVELHDIWQLSTPEKKIEPCEIIDSGPNSFDFRVTAHDPNQHMLSYRLRALWGRNQSATVFSDSYAAHVNLARTWAGVANDRLPAGGWSAACDCAHTFILRAWKRTINGYNYILDDRSHQSVTINNVGTACGP